MKINKQQMCLNSFKIKRTRKTALNILSNFNESLAIVFLQFCLNYYLNILLVFHHFYRLEDKGAILLVGSKFFLAFCDRFRKFRRIRLEHSFLVSVLVSLD